MGVKEKAGWVAIKLLYPLLKVAFSALAEVFLTRLQKELLKLLRKWRDRDVDGALDEVQKAATIARYEERERDIEAAFENLKRDMAPAIESALDEVLPKQLPPGGTPARQLADGLPVDET